MHIEFDSMYASYALGLLAQEEIDYLLVYQKTDPIVHCTLCGQDKPLSNFHVNSRAADKRDSWCKDCHRAYHQTGNYKRLHKISLGRRRARRKQLAATLTLKEWQIILEQYGHCCAYCGKHESVTGTLAQEHVVPVAQGGGYTALNIVPSCKHCNSIKSDRTPEEAGYTLKRIELNQLSLGIE